MYQPYTTQKQSISPTVALVRYVSSDKQITMKFPNGVTLNAIYVNNFTHEIAREGQISFKGPITIHLQASGIRNCYYLVWWSENRSQLVCSCYGFRKSGDLHCEHTDDVNQQQVEAPAQPVARPVVAEQVESTPRTREYWLEIVRKGKERDRAFLDGYWKEVKALQLEAQQSGSQQVF